MTRKRRASIFNGSPLVAIKRQKTTTDGNEELGTSIVQVMPAASLQPNSENMTPGNSVVHMPALKNWRHDGTFISVYADNNRISAHYDRHRNLVVLTTNVYGKVKWNSTEVENEIFAKLREAHFPLIPLENPGFFKKAVNDWNRMASLKSIWDGRGGATFTYHAAVKRDEKTKYQDKAHRNSKYRPIPTGSNTTTLAYSIPPVSPPVLAQDLPEGFKKEEPLKEEESGTPFHSPTPVIKKEDEEVKDEPSFAGLGVKKEEEENDYNLSLIPRVPSF